MDIEYPEVRSLREKQKVVLTEINQLRYDIGQYNTELTSVERKYWRIEEEINQEIKTYLRSRLQKGFLHVS